VALVLVAAFVTAARRAERDFFLGFADAHGLRYVGDAQLMPLTPLLGAGDRRECSHWMVGPLGDLTCGLGATSRGTRPTRSRRGLAVLFGDGWLSKQTRRKVELESLRLHERYELWVERTQDDLLLRQLFSPSFVAWLAEHPLEPCFEYRAGTLVVYLERRLEDLRNEDPLYGEQQVVRRLGVAVDPTVEELHLAQLPDRAIAFDHQARSHVHRRSWTGRSPTVSSAVPAHGTVTANGVSCTVPRWSSGKIGGPGELLRSVRRSPTEDCSSPV
jgi:hypothetical protein